MKQKSNKLNKLEKNRESLFTDDLTTCILCKRPAVNKHEIFFGRNRIASMKYKMVIPLCYRCHIEMHRNSSWQTIWHVKGQLKFEEHYPNLNFLEIFKKNYK